jgi:E3 ubiquitin-protein ligase RAD18
VDLFRVAEEEEEDRLPKVSYHIMKEKQLRDMLTRYSLNTSGDKNVLTARHQKWVCFMIAVCN